MNSGIYNLACMKSVSDSIDNSALCVNIGVGFKDGPPPTLSPLSEILCRQGGFWQTRRQTRRLRRQGDSATYFISTYRSATYFIASSNALPQSSNVCLPLCCFHTWGFRPSAQSPPFPFDTVTGSSLHDRRARGFSNRRYHGLRESCKICSFVPSDTALHFVGTPAAATAVHFRAP